MAENYTLVRQSGWQSDVKGVQKNSFLEADIDFQMPIDNFLATATDFYTLLSLLDGWSNYN